MSVHVLKFDSAGLGHCLYTEELDLAAIGTLAISRASNIEFNPATQEWEVMVEGKVLYAHPSRSQCLDWEHQHFNK